MKAIAYGLLSLLLLVTLSCNKHRETVASTPVQRQADVRFIDNRTLKYKIMKVACDTCAPIRDIGYRVRISLSAREDSLIRHISKGQWLSMLSSNQTDFAANLLLYRLYERDALVLLYVKNASDWRLSMKADDLHYWQQTLK